MTEMRIMRGNKSIVFMLERTKPARKKGAREGFIMGNWEKGEEVLTKNRCYYKPSS